MDAMSSVLWMEERLCDMATKKKIPLGGSFELLPLCNMNCEMCYVRLERKEMERKGRIRSGEEWLSLAKEMVDEGTLFVLLTGGEPLLHPDFCMIYRGLLKLGMIITLNTNGTLIDEEMADFLARYHPRRVNITIYGKNPDTYKRLCHFEDGFERAVRGVRLLCDRGVDVKLNGSISKRNQKDIDALLKLSRDLEVPINIDTYMYPAGRERDKGFRYDARLDPGSAARAKVEILKGSLTDEEYRQYCATKLRMIEKKIPEKPDLSVRCRAGRSSFVINWQGNMTPCVMLKDPSMNVFEVGFSKSWKYIVKKADAIRISQTCGKCTMRNVCQTCAACAFLEAGSYDGVPEYMCRYTEETLRLLKKSLEEEQERRNG